ncbi:nuclear factor erythroid 2-related factor 1-like [Stegastes partitus]|uniref:Endoplasmic reticulum membrane sensor NFE2L1 n=1 Tax=Stegastes partitus TaxID=144197 RepID=A0A9Y4K8M7_9TELE|nr:PREDICTED: nuclear factor erythroid 2-related factor 1-like [Stegastes partitus]
MLYLKKYFTEGLIQMAILLSLCGMRVDVGLEPYLPPSWHEMILGPTSALTQTQFHNLRNRLEEGHNLHPKSVDLDGFFTARRLLGWVRSLDRLQVPHPELQTWLVQREPDALPVGCSDQPSLRERAPAGVERDRTSPSVEVRAELSNLEDEDEEEEKETSLQECLRLLEETFPFTDDDQLSDADGRQESESSHREPQLSPIIPTGNPSLDLELDWQDLLSIMDPENTDVDMTASFEDTLDVRPSGTFRGVGSEAPPQNSNSLGSVVTEADQALLLMDAPPPPPPPQQQQQQQQQQQHGVFGPQNQAELEPALLPLTPSAELDDHSSALNTRRTLENPQADPFHRPPDHTDLLAEDPSEDFGLGLNAEDNPSTFNMNLLTQEPVDRMEPETLPGFDVNFNSCDLTPSSFGPSLEENDMTRDLLASPSGDFLVDEEDGEDGLPSRLSDLLEDATILDEIRLLDLALEEGFSPEMAARLEEEGYLDREVAHQETDRDDDHSGSDMVVTEDQGQPGRHQQDGENEADSDSGLSLDFSHSPASPSASEASSYSSSSSSCSSSSSSSSPSCASAVGSLFSEDEDEDDEEAFVGPDMEVEVTIKQEEMEEEEMGAVGGGYPGDVNKLIPSNYEDHKLFHDFSWMEHIGHDHTYNQPRSPESSPYLGKMPTKHTKPAPHHDTKPYHRSSSRHISMSKMWSRDERRAQTLKIPFSNELIVNLPVEEFNDLLTNYQLDEEQLALIRDIRRRGKNKIAAQNCRKRKQDVLLGLDGDVAGLRRQRSRLLREKQEALRNLQEMKRRLGVLYQEVFSRLRDEEGRPLDATEYLLHFDPSNTVTVASRQQMAEKPSKKQRDRKK